MKRRTIPALMIGLLAFSTLSYGHGGGLNKDGCHTNSKTNSYHCHGAKSSPEDKAPQNRASKKKGYDRDSWKHWSDLDGDGRDTREQLLAESSLEPVVYRPGTDTIIRGLWKGVYTGKSSKKASAFHIDHVIPLAYASRAGGESWPRDKKEAFANDPINVVIATASANTSKSDRGPEEWMPRKKETHCDYLMQWVEIASKYDLYLKTETINYIESREECWFQSANR